MAGGHDRTDAEHDHGSGNDQSHDGKGFGKGDQENGAIGQRRVMGDKRQYCIQVVHSLFAL